MAFEHAFATTDDFSWSGSSARADGTSEDERINTLLRYANGTEQTFAPGEPLSLPLHAWLHAANASLDDLNEAVPADPLGRLAPKRSTGINVRVDIAYSNVDRASGRPVPGRRKMHAEVSLQPEIATWTGTGTSSTWVRAPHQSTRCAHSTPLLRTLSLN